MKTSVMSPVESRVLTMLSPSPPPGRVCTSIVIPGLGLFVAGPIAAALAGAGAGGATGGLIGLLVGTGIPEHRARVYDTGVRGGGILLGVEAKSSDEVERLETLLEDIGAEYVRTE